MELLPLAEDDSEIRNFVHHALCELEVRHLWRGDSPHEI
jgi:hypothetical protein